MALNNFLRVELVNAQTLVVHGETIDDGVPANLGPQAQIFVAVISQADPDNRASPPVDDPSVSPWTARTDVHHFNAGDEVFAVGSAAAQPGDTPFLWADDFTVEPAATAK
jgi:hypothetical protein